MSGGPVLALVGPTGSGKSALAADAGARFGAEIVAVDAFTVYRGMDVGTAKPSQAQRRLVPHHCLDLLEVNQEADVRWFQGVAREAVADIRGRGGIPLLVGGSGLYFRAVVDPLEFPPTDAKTREDIRRRHLADPHAAHAELARVDPEAAAAIEPGNLRRTVRALEVRIVTGRPFSSYRTSWDRYRSIYPWLHVVGVERGRDELAARIAQRTRAMLREGLVAECRALQGRSLSATAAAAIGYAEVLDHLAGRCTLDEAVERIDIRTRRYAVRQQRWFNRDPRVRWTAPEEVVAALLDGVRASPDP